jgi:hypothetical protein
MKLISRPFALIINLAHASREHKNTCINSECNTSIMMLRETAQFILPKVRDSEMVEAAEIINEMPII